MDASALVGAVGFEPTTFRPSRQAVRVDASLSVRRPTLRPGRSGRIGHSSQYQSGTASGSLLRCTGKRSRLAVAFVQLDSDRAGVTTPASTSKEATTPPDAAVSQPSTLPQLWSSVKVVPHLPGSASSASVSRRSEASSSSLNNSSSRDSSATLNWSGKRK